MKTVLYIMEEYDLDFKERKTGQKTVRAYTKWNGTLTEYCSIWTENNDDPIRAIKESMKQNRLKPKNCEFMVL